jgi:hypothetical protein
MLDFIAERITPGLPDQDCRVYDMEGKLKRVISNVKMAPEVGQTDCLGRPLTSEQRQRNIANNKKRRNRIHKYNWPEIIPQILDLMEQGVTKRPEIAERMGIDVKALNYQILYGNWGGPVRAWLKENKPKRKDDHGYTAN